jgi:hypothetical protein
VKHKTTRHLWAMQTLMLSWELRERESEYEYIQSVGRELMRRTDTSPERCARAAVEQAERRRENGHVWD